jgi:hypothetical protein
MATKKAAEKKPVEAIFGERDKVIVTYKTGYYQIDRVPGIIYRKNRREGFAYQVRLQNPDGSPINMGHDSNMNQPGSGPFIFVDDANLELVEKYTPKTCVGVVKDKWIIGDKFMPKADFDLDQDDFDDITGVVPEMVNMKGKVMTCVGFTTRFGPTWIIDGTENYAWLPNWVDPVE